jgi:hypothetical protein
MKVLRRFQDSLSKDCVLLSSLLQSRPAPCSLADLAHFLCFTTLPVMRLLLAPLILRMEDLCFSET